MRTPIEPVERLAHAIFVLGHGSPFRISAEFFRRDHSTVYESFYIVVNAILHVLGGLIKFPTGDDAITNCERFEQKTGLLNVVALVDGSHIDV